MARRSAIVQVDGQHRIAAGRTGHRVARHRVPEASSGYRRRPRCRAPRQGRRL